MGRVIHHEVVGIRCELATSRGHLPSCSAMVPVTPVPATSTWIDQAAELAQLVSGGWAFVLTPKLRAYCPEHAERVWGCTCRTHPDRAHLCTVHGAAFELVWAPGWVPDEVREVQALEGARVCLMD